MKREECGSCHYLGWFCGKSVCRATRPKRYLRNIDYCDYVLKRRSPYADIPCRRCAYSRYQEAREGDTKGNIILYCTFLKTRLEYDSKVEDCGNFKREELRY